MVTLVWQCVMKPVFNTKAPLKFALNSFLLFGNIYYFTFLFKQLKI